MAFLDWADERTYAKNTLIIMMTDWIMIGVNHLCDIVTYDADTKGWDNKYDSNYYTKGEIDTKLSPITNQLDSIGTIYSSGQKTLRALATSLCPFILACLRISVSILCNFVCNFILFLSLYIGYVLGIFQAQFGVFVCISLS